ncbi:TerB family tellurite resistance protein, partial [Candidatus Pelagibacter sp.]|nr:TerB family tellurite resistance protein [Candidatus Pelagibacter sp.]
TLIELGADSSNIDKLISEAAIIEENSNQILNFTREVKNAPDSDKIKIIDSLWRIIYSDDNADMYETNLMRRLSGLLYIDPKIMGNSKEKIKKELKKKIELQHICLILLKQLRHL